LFLPPSVPSFAALPLAAAAAVLTGLSMGGICALLKRCTGANEMITSFLLSAAVSPVCDYLIVGVMRDTSGSLLATPRFASVLPHILPPSALSLSAPLVLLLFAASRLYLYATGAGYRFRVAGSEPSFAVYGGISHETYWTGAMGASGAFAGLDGFFFAAGTDGLCYQGFSGGLGWSGLTAALIAGKSSFSLLPVALVYSSLSEGLDKTLEAAGISLDAAVLVEGAVLLFATVQLTRKPTGVLAAFLRLTRGLPNRLAARFARKGGGNGANK
jgi:simple sugar transport system permease protein